MVSKYHDNDQNWSYTCQVDCYALQLNLWNYHTLQHIFWPGMLCRLLQKNPNNRLSVESALRDPWMRECSLSEVEPDMEHILDRLQTFGNLKPMQQRMMLEYATEHAEDITNHQAAHNLFDWMVSLSHLTSSHEKIPHTCDAFQILLLLKLYLICFSAVTVCREMKLLKCFMCLGKILCFWTFCMMLYKADRPSHETFVSFCESDLKEM